MIGFERRNGILCADDVPLTRIAEEVGTPTYIYSASQIQANIDTLRNALVATLPAERQPLIAFACKSNDHLAILSLMAKQGLGADVVSGGELKKALKAGINPQKIVFSGVGKTDEEIAFAIAQNILQFNVESESEYERIAALAKELGKKASVAFRLNPDVDGGTHAKITTGKKDNKFGLSAATVEKLYALASGDSHIITRGLSVHIGSQLFDLTPFREAFAVTAALIQKLKKTGYSVPALDLGGGLGITYRDESTFDVLGYAALIRDLILPLNTEIILEPGRFLVGNAGVLLTRVVHIKESDTRRFVIVDAGMNDMVRPAMYDAYHTIVPVCQNDAPQMPCDIVGPVCESSDVFGTSRLLPPVERGDVLAVMTCGAYGFTMASTYNARVLPAEVMVLGDKFQVIRARKPIETFFTDEETPAWI